MTGPHQFEDGGGLVDDSGAFGADVSAAHGEAMAVRNDGIAMVGGIGGMTFTPGIYRSSGAVIVTLGTVVTLDGLNETNPVFLFQCYSTLDTGANSAVVLKNGATAENVLWALGTTGTLGANSVLVGSIIAGTAITFGLRSELRGCALAETTVTFDSEGSIGLTHSVDGAENTEARWIRHLRGSKRQTQFVKRASKRAMRYNNEDNGTQ